MKEKNNSVDYYFDDINSCTTLTQAEIVKHIGQIRDPATPPDQARELTNKIIEGQLKLVIKFAKEYQKVGVPLADLIQEGNLGLMRALEKYDTSKDIQFNTYAVWWIKQGFLKAIKGHSKLIRLPTYVQEALSRIEKTRERVEKDIQTTLTEWSEFLTPDEIADLYKDLKQPTLASLASSEGMSEEELEIVYNISLDPISLDAVVPGEQKNLKDFIPDINVDIERDVHASRLSDGIRDALQQHLTVEEQEVMVYRYGLFGQTIHTLEECAALLGRSREHIRQIDSTAREKLKKVAAHLDDFRS